jgi:hypothetical protein
MERRDEIELSSVVTTNAIPHREFHESESGLNQIQFITKKATQSLAFVMLMTVCFYNLIECLKNIYHRDISEINSDFSLGSVRTHENLTLSNSSYDFRIKNY